MVNAVKTILSSSASPTAANVADAVSQAAVDKGSGAIAIINNGLVDSETVSDIVRSLSGGETGVLWDLVDRIVALAQSVDMSQFFSIAGAPAYATGS